jgi:DNA-binding HxlR family transcriptional regulator
MNLVGALSDRDSWRATECSIDKAMGVVGTRSAMLILREAFYGTTRFDDFTERVGLTPAVAAGRLKDLVIAGILHRLPYREPGSRTRDEYHLTDRGRDLLPVLLALQQWGDRHLQAQGPAIEVVDASGSPVRAAVIGSDGKELTPEELRVRTGPRMRGRAASQQAESRVE